MIIDDSNEANYKRYSCFELEEASRCNACVCGRRAEGGGGLAAADAL